MNINIKGTKIVGIDKTTSSVEYLKTLGYSASDIDSAFADAAELETLELRKAAYSIESDPLFLEALRKDAAGDVEGAEAARAEALKVVDAIKARFPLAV